MVSIHKT